MAKRQATDKTVKKGDEAPIQEVQTEISEMKETKSITTEVNFDELKKSASTDIVNVYRKIVMLQRAAKKKGEPSARRYTIFAKSIEQNCKKVKIDLPKKSDIF